MIMDKYKYNEQIIGKLIQWQIVKNRKLIVEQVKWWFLGIRNINIEYTKEEAMQALKDLEKNGYIEKM